MKYFYEGYEGGDDEEEVEEEEAEEEENDPESNLNTDRSLLGNVKAGKIVKSASKAASKSKPKKGAKPAAKTKNQKKVMVEQH